jgi:uncharacterized protein YaeQ
MSFVEAFYSFTIELTAPDRDLYEKIRLKIPRHPHESLQFLYARVIAFLHAYRSGQEFSRVLFEPKEPTIWHKDVTGDLLLWLEVGCPDETKLQRVIRRRPQPELRIYFFAPEQSGAFCHQLRGSTTNWVEPVQFYSIEPALLEGIVPLERSSSRWAANFIDTTLYLTVDGHDFISEVAPLDIWAQYQSALENLA